jgi:predicted nucleic acid-binding protein
MVTPFTSNFIADETLTLLRYRAGRGPAVQFGDLLYSGKLCRLEHVTKADQKTAWRLFLQYRDHCFSFTDCTSFSLMKPLRIETAIAIDSDFRGFGLHCLPA